MFLKYLIFILYLVVLFGIGIFASRKIKNLKDYYVGGKNLGHWVVAFSARATGESAWLLLGLTGMGAIIGFKAFWVVFGEVLGVALCWLFMARPFKRLTDSYGSLTIPDYLDAHFKDQGHLLRKVAAFILTVFVTIYVSAQIDATGKAFESFFEWNYYTGIFVGMVIVVFYTFWGGFVAVAWSDVFQGIIMGVGLVLLPIAAYLAFSESYSFQNIYSSLESLDPSLVSFWGEGGSSLVNFFSILGLLSVGLGFLGSPQVFVRFISVKNQDELKKGTPVAIIYTLITDSAAVMIGVVGRLVLAPEGLDVTDVLGQGGQEVLPLLVEKTLPVILVGLYIAAVLAAIMSTIDSLLVLASSAVTRDYYQKTLHPEIESKDLSRLSRYVTLGMALVALILALIISVLSPDRTIYWFVIFGWSGIAASFCPMIILSLFWKSYNTRGALASMISGFLSIPLFKFIMPQLPGVGVYFAQWEEMMPSFLVSFFFGFVFTKMSAKTIDKN